MGAVHIEESEAVAAPDRSTYGIRRPTSWPTDPVNTPRIMVSIIVTDFCLG